MLPNIVIVITLVVTLAATSVNAAACTAAQLSAPDGRLFKFVGGGPGPYFTGTNQIASYDRPAGSNVASINELDIVGPATAILSNTAIPFPPGSVLLISVVGFR